jgi:membrane protein involved in D-alanine export
MPLFGPDNLVGFIGLSYLTFRTLDVVFNIQDGLISQLPPVDYLAYLLFFPTISSGPIDRYRRFLQDWQYSRTRAEFMADVDASIHRIFRGFLYKFILAVLIKQYWLDPAARTAGRASIVSYMYAYSFYLFFDFAGYSAFAIGISYLLGIRSPENFDRPFFARDIREFWDRWHISLSWWFRDHVYARFVYAALKGKWLKNKATISYLGYFVSMGLMGLWHGLTWYYVLYGLYHATLLVGYDLFGRWNKLRGGVGKRWGRWSNLASWFVTFNLVCVGLLLFSGRLDSRFAPVAQATTNAMSLNTSVGCSGSNQTLPSRQAIKTNGDLTFFNSEVITITADVPIAVTTNGDAVSSTNRTYSFKVTSTGQYTITASTLASARTTFTVHCINFGPAPMAFMDGRCNQDSDQSVAIYPDGFGGYNLYAIDTGKGSFALRLSKAQLLANLPTKDNYLIAQNLAVPVYRLTDGTLQTQRWKSNGELYVFNWTTCGWSGE